MRSRSLIALGMVGLLGLTGCAAMQERRWGKCAVAGGVIGALVGAGTAGGLVNAYEGGDGASHEETGAAAGGGAVVGAGVGTLIGHLLCDPKEMPPPPPPAPAPPPPPPPPAPRKLETISGPNFDFDKAHLRPQGEAKVDHVVRLMQESPSMRVVAEGHTDSVGSHEYNVKLSERRAEAVKDYMVSKGISASRITTRGLGEADPIASNKTAAGRAQNRRVEIIAQ